MITTILDYLEKTAKDHPYKIAFQDKDRRYTFTQLMQLSKTIGTFVLKETPPMAAIVVFMEKGAHNIPAFMGCAYAGCYYVPIDKDMPVDRIRLICDVLRPRVVIHDHDTAQQAHALWEGKDVSLIDFGDVVSEKADEAALQTIRIHTKTTDILYVLFTSGSTGIPKGVTISHRAVIDFIEWMGDKYKIDERNSFCSQAPFYFDASIPDIYMPIKTGATLFIPPKSYYTFPKKILRYIVENDINTLVWVPSALCNVINCRAFDVCVPDSVRLVIFCGEVMPCKYLNEWRRHIPDALYVNMYGPTEATYACTYYDIEREYSDGERLPLGKPCENSGIILLTEDGQEAEDGQVGEICILGECLSNGYYNDDVRTEAVFVQNPLNRKWRERMYKTGDLAYIDQDRNLIFAGRKDFQIKKLGHRIELGEIENAILAEKEVMQACCLFDEKRSDIIAVYTGHLEKDALNSILTKKIPSYMMPDRYVNIKTMPMNINGKIDRHKLKELYGGGDLDG